MKLEELKRLTGNYIVWGRIEGIRCFSAIPVIGIVTIKDDPAVMDITGYFSEMAAGKAIKRFYQKGALHELH